jgi:hypothetical protein
MIDLIMQPLLVPVPAYRVTVEEYVAGGTARVEREISSGRLKVGEATGAPAHDDNVLQ